MVALRVSMCSFLVFFRNTCQHNFWFLGALCGDGSLGCLRCAATKFGINWFSWCFSYTYYYCWKLLEKCRTICRWLCSFFVTSFQNSILYAYITIIRKKSFNIIRFDYTLGYILLVGRHWLSFSNCDCTSDSTIISGEWIGEDFNQTAYKYIVLLFSIYFL